MKRSKWTQIMSVRIYKSENDPKSGSFIEAIANNGMPLGEWKITNSDILMSDWFFVE